MLSNQNTFQIISQLNGQSSSYTNRATIHCAYLRLTLILTAFKSRIFIIDIPFSISGEFDAIYEFCIREITRNTMTTISSINILMPLHAGWQFNKSGQMIGWYLNNGILVQASGLLLICMCICSRVECRVI